MRVRETAGVDAIDVRTLRVVRGGRLVLDDVALTVRAGCVTGLLGPSGSGKTTLIRAIVGVQQVVAGEVSVLGKPAGAASLRTRVAYATQSAAVYDDLSVRENLAYFGRILDADAARSPEVIARTHLEDVADRVVAKLSGGQRARVSLAVALLGNPKVLVLDEPTVGLDPVLRRDLWALFHELADGGATVLVSTHVMDEADHCDELVLLRDGGVLATGTPAALRREAGAETLDEVFLRLVETR